MAIKKVPRLRFGYACKSRRRDRVLLKQVLRDSLEPDNATWRVSRSRIPGCVAEVESGELWFSVQLDRDRYNKTAWVVSIAPLVSALFYTRREALVPAEFTPGLRDVCRCIHDTIVGLRGVRTPHWYSSGRTTAARLCGLRMNCLGTLDHGSAFVSPKDSGACTSYPVLSSASR